MQSLEVSGAVRPINGSLGVKRLTNLFTVFFSYVNSECLEYLLICRHVIWPVFSVLEI